MESRELGSMFVARFRSGHDTKLKLRVVQKLFLGVLARKATPALQGVARPHPGSDGRKMPPVRLDPSPSLFETVSEWIHQSATSWILPGDVS